MLRPSHFLTEIDKLMPKLIDLRRKIHMNPELGYQEKCTSKLVLQEIENFDIEIATGVVDTGIVGIIEGGFPGPTVMLRADMDALPIQELNRDIDYSSKIPNVMHACGHDAHTAILIGAVNLLYQMRSEIHGRIKFFFQPAEEEARQRIGDKAPISAASQAIETGLLDGVSAAMALHLWPDLETGVIGIRKKAAMAGSCWFKIMIAGKSVHAAQPHKGLDSITAVANLINLLQLTVTREIDPAAPVLLNIGTISGGYRRNVVADKIEITGTVRALDQDLLENVFKEKILRTVEGLCHATGTSFRFDYFREVPVLYNDPNLLNAVYKKLLYYEGIVSPLIVEDIALTGEDFAYYSQEVPSLFLWLGCKNQSKETIHPLHSPQFNFDEQALKTGVFALISATDAVIRQLREA